MRVFTVLILLLMITACESIPAVTSALPSSFSTENIMKVHQGMRSEEVLSLFGEPNSIETAVCGQATSRWNCTTWEYGNFPYDRASFTFSGEHDALILNNFSVDRDQAW